jgi:hypothetical protein
MPHFPKLLICALLVLPLASCSADDGDDGDAAASSTGGSAGLKGTYDGIWDTDFGPTDYPVRGMSFTVDQDELILVETASFWDLQFCLRSIPSRFDVRPGEPIKNGKVSVQPLNDGAIRLEALELEFLTPVAAKGSLLISFDDGAPCKLERVPLSFRATRR